MSIYKVRMFRYHPINFNFTGNPRIWKGSVESFNIKKGVNAAPKVPQFAGGNQKVPTIRDQAIIQRYTMIKKYNERLSQKNEASKSKRFIFRHG